MRCDRAPRGIRSSPPTVAPENRAKANRLTDATLAAMLHGVIFDLDGTLGDTLPVCFAAFRTVFREYLGVTYSDDEIRAMFGPTEEGILEDRLPANGTEALDRYLAVYGEMHDLAPEPFPGIVAVLDQLDDRDVPVAVVTGKGPRSAALSLDAWGLRPRFTHVFAGGDHGNIKDTNMQSVIEAWGARPAAVVSVGDAPSDVTAARSVGAVPVGAAWAATTDRTLLEELEPEAIFGDVPGFAAWVAAR